MSFMQFLSSFVPHDNFNTPFDFLSCIFECIKLVEKKNRQPKSANWRV